MVSQPLVFPDIGHEATPEIPTKQHVEEVQAAVIGMIARDGPSSHTNTALQVLRTVDEGCLWLIHLRGSESWNRNALAQSRQHTLEVSQMLIFYAPTKEHCHVVSTHELVMLHQSFTGEILNILSGSMITINMTRKQLLGDLRVGQVFIALQRNVELLQLIVLVYLEFPLREGRVENDVLYYFKRGFEKTTDTIQTDRHCIGSRIAPDS